MKTNSFEIDFAGLKCDAYQAGRLARLYRKGALPTYTDEALRIAFYQGYRSITPEDQEAFNQG